MDFQRALDAFMASGRMTRSGYHLTLGAAIHTLEGARGDAEIIFDTGASPGDVDSYRGYYSDLAFHTGKSTTVQRVLKNLQAALNATFEGYKGGDFVMGAETPLWVSGYGEASGVAVVGIEDNHDTVVLITKHID